MTRPSADARERAERMILLISRFGQVVGTAMSVRVGDAGLIGNLPLLVLSDLDLTGDRRPTEIQALTGLSSGGVTKLLDRLEDRGLIARSFGTLPEDRRAVVVSITPEGRRVAGLVAAAVDDRLDDVRAFSDDLAELLVR
jgi:DNA-binding MarR family transcriptional regulator